ncbi:MAG: hypothetical protein ABMA26_14455 [Limisphaerales bacterium]
MRLALLLLLFLLLATSAQAATLKTWSRSVQLGTLRGFDAALGYYDVLATTTDSNSSNVPRYYITNGLVYVSGELVQDGTSSYYETEYLILRESTGTFIEWGAFASLNFPTTDSNGNLLPDWVERDFGASFTITGTRFVDYPATYSESATFTASRVPGSLTGTYSLRFGSGVTLTGTMTVSHSTGTLTVNRAADSVNFSFGNELGTRTASASFTALNHDQVRVGIFTATMPGRADITSASPLTLYRSGTRFLGALNVTDGLTDTPWADFRSAMVEITDTADTDGDGVPDLSDALLALPAIVRQPVPRFDFPVTPGYTYRLRGSTDLKTWTDYATHTASGTVWQYTPPAGSRAFLKIVSP